MYIFVSGMCMKHCKLHISQYYHSDWSRSESTAIPENPEYHQVHKNKTLHVQCNHYNKEHSHLKAHFNQSQHTHTHCKLMITTNSSSVTIYKKHRSRFSKEHNHSLIPVSDSANYTSLIDQHIACLYKFDCQTLTNLFFSLLPCGKKHFVELGWH